MSAKKNYFYNTAYQLLTILLPLVTTPYISRVLGADGLGVYSYAYSKAYYFAIIVLLGLNLYGNRTIAAVRYDKTILSFTFFNIYSIQLVLGLLACLLYIIYMFLCNGTSVEWMMIIYILSSMFDISWFFSGLEKFKLCSIRSITVKVISTVLLFILVKDQSDVLWYSLLMVISLFATSISLWPFLRKEIIFIKPKGSEIKKHIKPAFVLFLPVIAVSLYKVMDKIMLGYMTSERQVGFYNLADNVIAIPIALVTSLGQIMLPKISFLVANKKMEEVKQYIRKSTYCSIIISSIISFGIMGVSKEFVPLFYGDGYEICIILLQILLPSSLFISYANVIRTQILIPNGRDKEYVISLFCGAIVNIFLNYILIPKYEAVGAAFGTLMAEATVCIIQVFTVKSTLNLKTTLKNASPFMLSSVVMYVILRNIEIASTKLLIAILIKIFVGAMLYFGILIVCFVILYFFKIEEPMKELKALMEARRN